MRSTVDKFCQKLDCGFVFCKMRTYCLTCSPFEAKLQRMHRPMTHHSYRVRNVYYLLPQPPSRKSFLPVDYHILRLDARSIASPVTQHPEFDQSTESLLKTLFPLKKNDNGNKSGNVCYLEQLGQLVLSLHRCPSLAGKVWRVGLVPKLIEFSRCGVSECEKQARMALSLIGYAPPYSGRGLRILSVDGGGTR